MPVIGTAGHVDHGKSTLVEALTGRDPDRWAEEKERGLTIDLGFGWAVLDGVDVSFVDVPGHERFIRNMLAGTETIDAALFVVAADEGWMPQSEEHLAVLDLLGVTSGVIAITKIDRVDAELAELAELEVADRLAGTMLEDCPIIGVSAVSDVGLDELRAVLAAVARAADEARTDTGRPRMWVDRAFTIAGAGTVVTGTLLDGSLEVGQAVEVWPGPSTARVRSLQSHERDVASARPGRRTAVNLGGVERAGVGRGTLLAAPDSVFMTTTATVHLRVARYVEGGLDRRGAYHLHLGTGVWPIELRPVGRDRIADAGLAVLRSDRPFPAGVGDRFIVRETGRQAVVAGGQIVDPDSDARPRHVAAHIPILERVPAVGPNEAASLLLEIRGRASRDALSRQTGGGVPKAGLVAGDVALSDLTVAKLLGGAEGAVGEFHVANPLRPGMPKASLASRLDLEVGALDQLITSSSALRDDGATVALADFEAGLTADQEAIWEEARATLASAGWSVPTLGEIAIDREMLHVLLREERLVRIADDLVYLPEQLAALEAALETLGPSFSVPEFKEALAISRKYAVPLLEWLDATGVTIRDGDVRRLR